MLVEKILNQFEKNSLKKFPCHANRVSSIGHPCERMLVYSITRWGDRKLPTPELMAIFHEGDIQERQMRLDLLKAGIEIDESQLEVSFPKYNLFGHGDGTWTYRKKKRAIEFKTVSVYIFGQLNRVEDLTTSKHSWHRCYIPQINLYMKGMGLKHGIIILKNKNTGWLKEIEVKLDNSLCHYYFDRCTRINKAVDESKRILQETYNIKEIADFDKKKDREDYQEIRIEACNKIESVMPERITDNSTCEMCPFSNICLPDEIRTERAKVWINTELESKLIRRESLDESRKEYDVIDKEVKEVVKQSGMVYFICGDFEVTVKTGKNTVVKICKINTETEPVQ